MSLIEQVPKTLEQAMKMDPSLVISTETALALMGNIFIEQMPFNQLLGIQLATYQTDHLELQLEMHPKLIGNPIEQILHGGVTASILDVAGGMLVAAKALESLPEITPALLAKRLPKLSTIDMRVDYLRPGRGKVFIATARVIRSGNKVSVARMEMHNEQGDHIAFGTGTYMVG